MDNMTPDLATLLLLARAAAQPQPPERFTLPLSRALGLPPLVVTVSVEEPAICEVTPASD